MLEEVTPSVINIKLGHLKPNSEASIWLTYVAELQAEGKSTRVTIPTTIAPRYIPPSDQSLAAKVFSSMWYRSDTPAPVSLQMNFRSSVKIDSISSPSHDLEVLIKGLPGDDGLYHGAASFSAKTSDMDRDIVVVVAGKQQLNKPKVIVERSDKFPDSGAAMVSLVPRFVSRDQQCEFIFVVDRSGSMESGGKIGGCTLAQIVADQK